MLCLEIGPGDGPARVAPGETWNRLTANITKGGDHYHARWGTDRLPWPENMYDLVYASHVIEHIPWYKTVEALREAHRILKPTGHIEIWTVDFERVMEAYTHGAIPDAWRRYNPEGLLMKWINGRIFAYDKGEGDELNMHRACFDRNYLRWCLTQAGFNSLVNLEKPRGEDHGHINMGVGGTK